MSIVKIPRSHPRHLQHPVLIRVRENHQNMHAIRCSQVLGIVSVLFFTLTLHSRPASQQSHPTRKSVVFPGQPGQSWGADLQDLADEQGRLFPEAKHLLEKLSTTQELLSDGAKIAGPFHILRQPLIDAAHNKSYALAVLLQTETELLFREFTYVVFAGPKPKGLYEFVQDIPLNSTEFRVDVGLISRIVLLRDQNSDLILTFPLGVGAIDFNIMGAGTRILTPEFQNATLRRATVNPARTDPSYYRNLPFMPITNRHGRVTDIAFHITILSDKDWNNGAGSNFLMRSFQSHGCMRMRGKDLNQLYQIVMHGGSSELPVNVNAFLNTSPNDKESLDPLNLAAPYPFEVQTYMQVKNFSPPGDPPTYQRDPEENLVVLEPVFGAPEFSKLNNLNPQTEAWIQAFQQALSVPGPRPNALYERTHIGN